MSNIIGTFPTTLQNGQPADATVVMQLMAFIQSQTNGNGCPATSGTTMLKGNGSGGTTNAVSGVDYLAPTSQPTIAILGDSLTAINLVQSQNWPDLMLKALNETGSNARLVNFAVSGGTFYRANTLASFGGNTPVQACIAAAPSVILVMLGANDLLVNIDGRTLVQVEADAALTLSTLAAALPSAKIIYISEQCYDKANYAAGSLVNRGTLPAFWTLRSSGILVGSYCPDILTDSLSGAMLTNFTNWATFDTYCKALSWGGLITLNYFQIARMGLTVPDGLHPNATGVMNICAQIMLGLSAVTGISTFLPGLTAAISTISANSSLMFSYLLSASGLGYTEIVTPDGEKFSFEGAGFGREYLPGEWFYPYKSKMTYAPNGTVSYAARQAIIFQILGVTPSTNVQLSVGGGAFSPLTLNSDDRGNVLYITDSQGFGGTGTFTFRYKIGTSITPNITITVT